MAEICGEKKVVEENVIFTCRLMKGHQGFHSASAVYDGKIRLSGLWSFRWGDANDMVIPEGSDRMKEIENLEEKLNKVSDTIFTVSLRGRIHPVLYTDWMWLSMDKIVKIQKVLKEFGLKIYSIGAGLYADGMYIETEGFE